MSNHRTACSFHQKWLNTHNTSTDLQPSQKHVAAATRIYTKSLNAVTNTVYSNRLGISYNTQLTVRRKDHPKAPDNTFEDIPVSAVSIPQLIKFVDTKRHHLIDRQHYIHKHIRHINFSKFCYKPNSLFPLPYSWHHKIRRFQPTDLIKFEEIFLSDEDLNSTWLGPSSSSQSSNIPLNVSSSHNETTSIDSFRNPTPPIERLFPSPPVLNPMHQRQLEIRAKKKAQTSQICQQRHAAIKREEAEAAEQRLIHDAFKFRVREFFAGPHPPLISMLNASVGYTSKQNFTKELSDEFDHLYMSESYNEVKLPLAFIKTSSNLLTDWQNDFHCFMIGSPVPSCITKAKKGRKKSKSRPIVNVPSYDDIWLSFNELYRAHMARNLNKFPMFTAQSVKRALPSTLDSQHSHEAVSAERKVRIDLVCFSR
ncbi:hypothetical protein C1645_835352 [Glomus cerebriforme]|uniref:Uncharacterized protein n=1 Tax=Glomus cerebriforme TaxID=658196 RepID=A0A397SEN1_9GLOM|nr:hypothetical protein C1645_835352 [Glomus cerebriforme]